MEFEQNDPLLELRRRVEADPAYVAFAGLADACRRNGEVGEAVALCKAGLQHHPGYLSARVTLALALIELARFDEAEAELEIALQAAPNHFAANRALAEIYQQRGQRMEAEALYRKTLRLARHDWDQIQPRDTHATTVAPAVDEPGAGDIPDLFDFDRLLEQLGKRATLVPELPQSPVAMPAAAPMPADDGDPFSVLERQLRVVEERAPQPPPSAEELSELRVLDELEHWLAAIVAERENNATA